MSEYEIPDDGIDVDLAAEPKKSADGKPSVMTDASASELDRLKQTIEAERRQRQDAERALSVERAARASDSASARLVSVEVALETTETQAAALKRDLIDAQERGDFQTAAEKTAEMSRLEAQRLRLAEGRDALKATRQAPQQTQQQLSDRSAAFIKARPDYVADPRSSRRLVVAHHDAVDAGLQVDSDDYFAFVDQQMQSMLNGRKTEQKPAARVAPVAPVQRDTPRFADGSSRVVRITKEQAELADELGMTHKEYAENLAALRASGVIGGA